MSLKPLPHSSQHSYLCPCPLHSAGPESRALPTWSRLLHHLSWDRLALVHIPTWLLQANTTGCFHRKNVIVKYNIANKQSYRPKTVVS